MEWSQPLERSLGVEWFFGVVFVNLADIDVLPLEIIVHVKNDHLKSASVFKQYLFQYEQFGLQH